MKMKTMPSTISSSPADGQILITGGEGMLGRAVTQVGQSMFSKSNIVSFGKTELDVTDADSTAEKRHSLSNGWIIHCAALVNVEECAKYPKEARKIIVEGTQNIINLANETGSRIFYPQSFLTYGDCDTEIPENYHQKPLSHYGELKLEAQQLIQSQCPNSLIATMGGFFGGEEKDKNFVGKIIPLIFAAMQRNEKVFAVGDRIWQPTWTVELAKLSFSLINANKAGVYQMACVGEASFFELAKEIVRLLGWSEHISIVPASTKAINADELGRRPNRAVLSCQRLKDESLFIANTWQASLAEYLALPYFDQYKNFQGNYYELLRA